MSKGPGKQQRRILAALEKCPAFYVAELCESGARAERVSLLRAARQLYDSGKIDIARYMVGGGGAYGPRYVAVMRRGYICERPKGDELLKCCTSNQRRSVQHL